MMQIKAQHYVLFYEELRQEYFERECKRLSPSSIVTRDIWKEKETNSKGEEVFITARLFYLTSWEYLFRKYDAAKKLPKDVTLPIREMTLLSGLEYIGIKHKNKLLNSASNEEKAKSLLQSYLIDKKIDPVDKEPNPPMDKKARIDSQNKDGINAISDLVQDFFQKINVRKYYDAWLLLTPHYHLKAPWRGNYFEFVNCFATVEMVSDIKLYECTFHKNKIEGNLFYRQTSKDYPMSVYGVDYPEEVEDFNRPQFIFKEAQERIERQNDIDDFEDFLTEEQHQYNRSERGVDEKILKLRKLILELEEKIEFKRLDVAIPIPSQIRTYLYFRLGENRDFLNEVFPHTPLKLESIDSKASFYYFEKRWLINHISAITPLL